MNLLELLADASDVEKHEDQPDEEIRADEHADDPQPLAGTDGFTLTGGGYRSPDQQVAVRRENCGSSDYAVYQEPPNDCHPPTAYPGTSMHEQGLAIDFQSNGSMISSHGDPAWQWLNAHAATYGFYNLPSEPWHWSVNGH